MPKQGKNVVVPIRPARFITWRPDGWQSDMSVAVDDEEHLYWPIRPLTLWLGLDPSGQIRKLARDTRSAKEMRYYILPSGRGDQPTWTLLERVIGYWFAGINDPRVRPIIKDKLFAFQDEIVDFAYDRLFGRARGGGTMNNDELSDRVRAQEVEIARLQFGFVHMEQRLGHVEGLYLPAASDSADVPDISDDREEEEK